MSHFVISFPKSGRDSIEYHNSEVPTQKIVCTEDTFFIFHRIAKILSEAMDMGCDTIERTLRIIRSNSC